jgi:predicted Rossmann fold flavoprotein
MWDWVIIGGGAAGLWAAGTAAQRGARVLVLEKNRKPGVKILMSGGTRCNITHHCDAAGIIKAFGTQGRFLKHAVHALPPAAVVAEINRWGVATKVEESGKVFPVSDSAVDVRDALVRRLTEAGAQLQTGVAVQDLRLDAASQWLVQTESESIVARHVLLCCGGLSYAGCGTTGDGYAWARRAGHTLVATYPALTPLLSPATWVHELTGITLPDVEARIIDRNAKNKDPRCSYRGGFLWTHFGCSGPVPMNVSRYVASAREPQHTVLQVDLVPELKEAELVARLDPAQGGRKSVSAILNGLLPRRMSQCLLERAGVSDGTLLAELPRAGRLKLIEDLKRLAVPLSGTRGYPKAEVTAGGVSTLEVNPHTMQSRLATGLYLAGEILDLDGPIGGFNFQAAFATGHLAALNLPIGP